MAAGFPNQDAVELYSSGYLVQGYDEKNVNMHLQEVTKNKKGQIVVAKGCGYAACLSGRGDTIEAARRNAHWLYAEANPKRLSIQKSQIRADIGERVLDQKEEIIELGLMTESEWEAS
jgi:phosphoribosylamine-glycine ligase